MKNQNFKKVFFIAFLVTAAIGERLWFDLGPNIELVTTATILASLYLGRGWGTIVPLLILSITDVFLGNTNIYYFTWSAFILEGLAASWLAQGINFQKKKSIRRLLVVSGMGGGASLWFYLWTNFGVWFLDSWGMYSRDWQGLIACYLNGLPFLKLNLLGNLFFLPLSFIIGELLVQRLPLLQRKRLRELGYW